MNMLKKIVLVCLGCIFLSGCVEPLIMVKRGDQIAGNIKVTSTEDYKYLIYLPKDYAEKQTHKKKWPLILYLHGDGSRGNNINILKYSGLPKLIADGEDFPFIIVSPQCHKYESWPGKLESLISLLNHIEAKYPIDKTRVYATGYSSGAFGCWALASFYPERFTAIVPISGGGEVDYAEDMKNVAVWAFHGAKDTTVSPERSKEMVDAVNAAGGDTKLTIYPNAGHGIWQQTYENPELYDWMLAHKR